MGGEAPGIDVSYARVGKKKLQRAFRTAAVAGSGNFVLLNLGVGPDSVLREVLSSTPTD